MKSLQTGPLFSVSHFPVYHFSVSHFSVSHFPVSLLPSLKAQRRRVRAGASSAVLMFSAAFAFASAPFMHPIADPIAQFFGVEIHARAAAREFESGREPARPEFLFH